MKINNKKPIGFAVSNYEQGGETQTRKFEASTDVEENDSVEHYFPPEEQEYHFPEVDKVEEQIVTVEETAVEEACPAYLCAANNKLLESTPITVGEPPKKTYASIVCTHPNIHVNVFIDLIYL